MLRPILWILTVAMALSFPADVGARVVINEIFYHAPEGIGDDLEFIELHNTDEEEEADISGWAFTKGIQFKFPADTGDSPAPARPMTPEQVGRVRTWSDQGAK